jgi:DNA (cytosine-5)-methyltransferase 1
MNAPREKLQLLDLFSGIGGFSLGLEASGYFETVAFCEIEKKPARVLNAHWPGVRIYDDVSTLTAERLRADGVTVDAICGGFPCQDVSESKTNAAGLDGARSGLWFEYARLIGELRPQLVFVENVSALLGRGLSRVLGSLATLGYDAEWHCIPAGHLGAPHERDRVWIIAYPATGERGAILSKGRMEGANGLLAQRQEDASRCSGLSQASWLRPWRAVADEVCGMDDGLPATLDGYNALANAVVPQIPEALGKIYGPIAIALHNYGDSQTKAAML